MRKLLFTLMFVCSAAVAELDRKDVSVVCGNKKDLDATLKKFNETPIIASYSKADNVAFALYGNIETGTTTWVAHLLGTDEYCSFGSGDTIAIHKNSILQPKASNFF